MKICKNCGAKNFDVCQVCETCKQPFTPSINVEPTVAYEMSSVNQPIKEQSIPQLYIEKVQQPQKRDNALSIITKILLISASVLTTLIFISGLVLWGYYLWTWCLLDKPSKWQTYLIVSLLVMAILLVEAIEAICVASIYCRRIFDGDFIGTGFKIYTLLFVNPVAGILMLCDSAHK